MTKRRRKWCDVKFNLSVKLDKRTHAFIAKYGTFDNTRLDTLAENQHDKYYARTGRQIEPHQYRNQLTH